MIKIITKQIISSMSPNMPKKHSGIKSKGENIYKMQKIR